MGNYTNQKILDLHKDGMMPKVIAETLEVPYDRVRNTLSNYVYGRKYAGHRHAGHRQDNDDVSTIPETTMASIPETTMASITETTMASEEDKEYTKIWIDSPKIRTVDEAIEYAKIDLTIWEVVKVKTRSGHWDVTTKNRATSEAARNRNHKHHIEITLKRRVTKHQEDAIDTLIKRMEEFSATQPLLYTTGRGPDNTNRNERFMLELSLFDNHFGMLAWHGDTMESQDLKIAESFYLNAVRDLLARSQGVDEILMPFGNDFFHTNNPFGMTPKKGNMLDTDGRLAKIFETAMIAVINSVYLCVKVAPVRIVWVPGNHDPETSYYLAKLLQAWFRNDKRVTIDADPHYRKHVRWGNSFIGFTHGDEEPQKELPRIFMDEFTTDWAMTKYREIHIGHQHKQKVTNYITTDSYGETVVRMMPSLCATDAWHYQKGYVGKLRAAMGLLWSDRNGVVAIYPAYARDE